MEFDAAVSLWAGNSEKLVDQGQKRARFEECQPLRRVVFGSGTNGAGGGTFSVTITDFVDAGRIWNVRRFSLFGADGHTTLTGASVDVYAGSSSLQLPDFSEEILSGQPVPSVNYPPREAEWLHYGESIIAYVYGAAANSVVELICKIDDWPVWAKEGMHI
jgi:hypothetical protein